MRGPEFGTKKEKEQLVGYSHNFERYIDVDGQLVDRLEQSLRFGFLSPKEAQRLGIPHKKNLNIIYLGLRDPDNVIFLFPLKKINALPRWSNAVSVVFDRSLEVLSWEEMNEYQGGWPNLSPMLGEVYVLRRIDPQYLRQILLPRSSKEEKEQVVGLVRHYVPKIADKIIVN